MGLRRQSDKKRAEVAATKPMRDLYLDSKYKLGLRCPVSGEYAHEVHEIARGPSRQLAVRDLDACLPVARSGHEELEDYEKWPLERATAAKCILCMDTIDACRAGRPRLDREEVVGWIEEMLWPEE